MMMPKMLLRIASMNLRALAICLLTLAGSTLLADPTEATITSPSGSVTVGTNQVLAFGATSSDSAGRMNFSVASYSWTFGDGTTGSGASTNHTYASVGTYTATLTVNYNYQICKTRDTDGNCLTYQNKTGTATATRVISVLAPPTISTFSASASSVGTGKPVTLSWSTVNATSLSISGVGPVAGTSKEVYPAGASNTYILSASNAVGTASASLTVTTYTVGVSINPASENLRLGQVRAFNATVSPANQGVTWSATGGTLSGSTSTATTFTAMASGPYTVKATSVEDPSKSITASGTIATVTLATPVPANPETFIGGSVSFSALVSGAENPGVNWTVNGGGAINGSGVFTATTLGSYTVTAISQADSTKTATALVVVKNLTVTIAPGSATVQSGQTQAFSASVIGSGSPNQAVTWSVVTSGGGTITPSGVFTASDTAGDYTVKATSVQDGLSFGTIMVHVPGWKLKWKRDIIYVGTKEIAEIDATGMHVTLVDHLGSPRFVVNAQGAVEAEQKFLPFGEQLGDAPSAKKFAKGFTNHEQTDPSGLIYMQARFYAPWYGRFLSPDPARDQHFEETQSWNIYSYVRNNPVTHIDPNGMEDYPIADMPQMRVLSLTQSGIPGARAEQMVAHEQQQRTVAGVTTTAALATGGFATSATGVGMLARVSAGLAAARDTIKEVASKVGNAIGNLTSKGNSQPASDPLTKVKEVINSASPMEPTSKGVGQGGLQNVQQTFQGLAKSLGVELQPGQTSFQAGNIRVGQHISRTKGMNSLDINLDTTVKGVKENIYKLREIGK